MTALLLDTSVVAILFKPDHSLHRRCLAIVTGHAWFISFITRAELLLWPRVNGWGSRRCDELIHHMDLCTTLLADENTCAFWAGIMADSRAAGRPVPAADAWLAAAAIQWDLPLVTMDYRDYEHLDGLTLIPVSR